MIHQGMEKSHIYSDKIKNQHKIRGDFDNPSPERDKCNSQIRFHLVFLHPYALCLNFYKVHIKSIAKIWQLNIQHSLICPSGLHYK